MRRTVAWRFLRHSDLLFLPVLHATLLYWLASRETASVLIAGGEVPWAEAFAALFFVLIRLATYLLLPGLILSRVIWLYWDYRAAKGGTKSLADESTQTNSSADSVQ